MGTAEGCEEGRLLVGCIDGTVVGCTEGDDVGPAEGCLVGQQVD